MSKFNSDEPRREMDERTEMLETIPISDDVQIDEQTELLFDLFYGFQYRQGERLLFATAIQVERLKRALPRLLTEVMPQLARHYLDSPSVRHLIDEAFPNFLLSIAKVSRAREQQSASGRGVFGRKTVEMLENEKAELAKEKAELAKEKAELAKENDNLKARLAAQETAQAQQRDEEVTFEQGEIEETEEVAEAVDDETT